MIEKISGLYNFILFAKFKSTEINIIKGTPKIKTLQTFHKTTASIHCITSIFKNKSNKKLNEISIINSNKYVIIKHLNLFTYEPPLSFLALILLYHQNI